VWKVTAVTVKGRRGALSDVEAASAGEMIQSGTQTVDQAAAGLGVHRKTLLRKLKKLGISTVRDPAKVAAATKAAATATATAVIGDPLERAKNIHRNREDYRKGFEFIGKLTLRTLADHVKTGRTLVEINGDLKTLNVAAKTLRLAQDGIHKALDIERPDSDDGKAPPELVVQVMTAEDVERMKEEREAAEDDLLLPGADVPVLPDPTADDDASVVIEGEQPDGNV